MRFRTLDYLMLYFFHRRATAVLSQSVVGRGRVPPTEIDRAAERTRQLDWDAARHTFADG
jgi:hypothetical protein